MYKIINRIAVFLLFVMSSTSSAGIIDFMGNNEGVENEFVFSQDGITLTVSAWTTNVNTAQQILTPWQKLTGDFGVYKGSTGLGVKSSDNDGSHLDGGQSSDLDDLDEGLLFSFSEDVNFMDFWAVYLTLNDDLNFSTVEFLTASTIQTTDIFQDVHGIPPIGYNGQDDYDDVFGVYPGIIGSHFMIWVDGNDDDVRIGDVGFTKVPEPGVLFLLAIALLMLCKRVRS